VQKIVFCTVLRPFFTKIRLPAGVVEIGVNAYFAIIYKIIISKISRLGRDAKLSTGTKINFVM
jgi:hypothetical protein